MQRGLLRYRLRVALCSRIGKFCRAGQTDCRALAGDLASGRLYNAALELLAVLQWRYAMENVLFVPPESFDPPPRVDSAVVRMVPHAQPAALDPKRLEEIVQVAFSQRRKILRHTLGRWLEEKSVAVEFDLQRRAEEVPVAEYVALAQTPTA